MAAGRSKVTLSPPKDAPPAAAEPGFRLAAVELALPEATLLSGIDLTIAAGSWSVLLGPSGSGKSTLLRLLNRLAEPTAGSVFWRGRALTELDVRALRREVGMVVQQPRLSEGTVSANLELPVRLGAVPEAEAPGRRERACELAQLSAELLARDVGRLSGGERQRVALARALMLAPQALLLDEPTSALDPRSARELMRALDRLRQEARLTLVMVTHRPAEIAERAEQVVVLDAGRIVEQGGAEVLAQPTHPTTRSLVSQEEDAP